MSRVVCKLPSSVIKRWNNWLKSPTAIAGVKHESAIDIARVRLFEEETYSVDITLMNGDSFSGPRMEVSFWDDGVEISQNVSMNERLDSEYNLTDRHMNKEFTLCIAPLD